MVIKNTPGQNVNAVAELVFDTMRRKSDNVSAVMVQRSSAMISARS